MRRRAKPTRSPVYDPDAGLPFDPDELESRLVWIWTSARSGSTWFLRLLSHPLKIADSRKDPDDYLGFRAPRTWQGKVDVIPVDTTFLANHLVPLAGRDRTGWTEQGEPASFAAALGLPNRANYFFSNKYGEAWRPELRRMMLVRFHRLIERTAERYEVSNPRVVLKEVAGAQAARLVMSLFPRSRMIFLVRDGRDVVDSQVAANQPGGWLPHSAWSTPEERLDFVRQRSVAWTGEVTMIRRAFESHSPALRRRIRYEDLLANPAGELEPLLKWLGLRRGERWLERAVEANSFARIPAEHRGAKKFYRSASPGSWRGNLTPEEQAAMAEVMGAKLAEFGYDPSGPESGDASVAAHAPPADEGGQRWVMKDAGEGRDFSEVARLVVKRGGSRSREQKLLALTFDDGPVLATRRVLDALESRDARATFFLVGRKLVGQRDLVRRIVAGGHEIGNHSFAHVAFPEIADIEANSELLTEITGAPPALYRPPFGAIDRPTAEAVIERGMRPILWSADSEDSLPVWKGASAEEVVEKVMSTAGPGAIVLMHDGLPWSRAVDALPELLVSLEGIGVRLTTVSELLAVDAEERGTADDGRGIASGSFTGHGPGPAVHAGAATELFRQLDAAAERGGRELADSRAEQIRRSVDDILDSQEIRSPLLEGEVGRLEGNAFYPVILGFAMRIGERGLGAVGSLPEGVTAELRNGDGGGSESMAVVGALAAPAGFSSQMAKLRLSGATAEIRSTTGIDGEEPDPRFLELFAPGPETWGELQRWATGLAEQAAERRLKGLLARTVAADQVDIERQVRRIDYAYLVRLGYVLAAWEDQRAAIAA